MSSSDDGYRLVKAKLCELLDLIRVGVVFERAEGDRLYYRQEGREVEILDLVGGFGSLLLGHNHPALVAEAQAILSRNRPIHAQGSRREPAGRLAQELSRRAGGGFRVVLANSGAEAVEAAMKHAMLETGGRTFITLERAFHGKTLGAVQLTANDEYRKPFEIGGLKVLRVRINDIGHLEKVFEEAKDPAAFVFEPIQGEGGIRPVEPAFAQRAAELCARRNVPMVADEIQCGMGRTGTFFAYEELGIKPDYIMLSKALGGGLAKVSALLVRRERYVMDFDRRHTSTYAEDDFSSLVALQTLEFINDSLYARCRAKGDYLLGLLRGLMQKYPDVLADVRGRGLLVGVEFKRFDHSRSFILRLLSSQEELVLGIMGYLFNVHRIRVAPTISDPFTLRMEPSSHIEEADLDRFAFALDDVCVRLRHGDALGLTGYFMRGTTASQHDSLVESQWDGEIVAYDGRSLRVEENSPTKVAWLCHLVDANDLVSFDPPFGDIPYEKREHYLRHLAPRARPIVMNSVDVQSVAGAKVRIHAILLPYTSRQIKRWMDEKRLVRLQASIQNGVEIARELDCRLVALGQYTSIVTFNGVKVRSTDIGITTGNSYAAALAIEALDRAQAERERSSEGSVLAVLGAAGNIGRACAEILAPRFRKAILIGSDKPGSRLRLEEVAKALPNAEISTDLGAVRQADAVVGAVNAVDAPLSSGHLARNAIVVDLSVPTCLKPETQDERPDVLVIKGGIVQLPFGEDLEIAGFPLPKGQTFACMAEGIMLGYEGIFDRAFTGSITADHVRRVQQMAAKHGFRLAEYKTKCVLGTHTKEQSNVLPL